MSEVQKTFPTLMANKPEVKNYTSDALKAKRCEVQPIFSYT